MPSVQMHKSLDWKYGCKKHPTQSLAWLLLTTTNLLLVQAQLVTVALPIVQRFVGQHRQFKASHRR